MDLSTALLLLLDGSIRILTNLHPADDCGDDPAAAPSHRSPYAASAEFFLSHSLPHSHLHSPSFSSNSASRSADNRNSHTAPRPYPSAFTSAAGDIIQKSLPDHGDRRRSASLPLSPRGHLLSTYPHSPAQASPPPPPALLVRDVLREFPGCALGTLESSRAHLPQSARIQAGGVYFLLPASRRDEERAPDPTDHRRQDLPTRMADGQTADELCSRSCNERRQSRRQEKQEGTQEEEEKEKEQEEEGDSRLLVPRVPMPSPSPRYPTLPFPPVAMAPCGPRSPAKLASQLVVGVRCGP
ncbi:unnamed protein product [Closterium sp. NIES-64]|nr:unnamed protein product [Closterium sp. NIES-64]